MITAYFSKEDANKITRFKEGLPRAVFNAFQKEIHTQTMLSVPVVTGRFKRSFKLNKVDSDGKNVRIAVITIQQGDVALLTEMGIKASIFSSLYGDRGMYLRYDENPHLRQWASKKGLIKRFPKGIRVGNPKTTRLGKDKNKWFTNSMRELRKTSNAAVVVELQKLMKELN